MRQKDCLWVIESNPLHVQGSLALGFVLSEQDHVPISSRTTVSTAFSVSVLCLILHHVPEAWFLPSVFLGLLENVCTYVCETELHGQKSKMLLTWPETWQWALHQKDIPVLWSSWRSRCAEASQRSVSYLSLGKWSPSIAAGSYLKFKTKIHKCNI